MKTSINIATYPPRLASLREAVGSVYNQVDIIRIYFNEYERPPAMYDPDKKIIKMTGENLTDNLWD